jgi:hypothetical protein
MRLREDKRVTRLATEVQSDGLAVDPRGTVVNLHESRELSEYSDI